MKNLRRSATGVIINAPIDRQGSSYSFVILTAVTKKMEWDSWMMKVNNRVEVVGRSVRTP